MGFFVRIWMGRLREEPEHQGSPGWIFWFLGLCCPPPDLFPLRFSVFVFESVDRYAEV